MDCENRVPLGRMARGANTNKGGTAYQHVVPGTGLSQPRMSGSWHKTTPRMGHITDTPSHGRKGEVPFLEQEGREILEKAVFRSEGERP